MSSSGSSKSKPTFLFAHGAGAGMDSDWMQQMAGLVEKQGINVVRFDFPYMRLIKQTGRRRPPDRMPKLIAAFETVIDSLADCEKLIVGGKSMGGRVASLLACQPQWQSKLAGVICLGFPFHPPAKPEKYKGEHLATMAIPTLLLQGERDSMGSRDELSRYQLSEKIELHFMPDGDHSFKPRVKSGLNLAENQLHASRLIAKFIDQMVTI